MQYRITDAVKAVIDTPDVAGLAYRAVQFALRRTIGSLTLDELLADKTKLSEDVQTGFDSELAKVGIAVTMVGIKDFILPGEMKTTGSPGTRQYGEAARKQRNDGQVKRTGSIANCVFQHRHLERLQRTGWRDGAIGKAPKRIE